MGAGKAKRSLEASTTDVFYKALKENTCFPTVLQSLENHCSIFLSSIFVFSGTLVNLVLAGTGSPEVFCFCFFFFRILFIYFRERE